LFSSFFEEEARPDQWHSSQVTLVFYLPQPDKARITIARSKAFLAGISAKSRGFAGRER
jgi:hypothetical protein